MNVPAMVSLAISRGSMKGTVGRAAAKALYEGKKFYIVNPDGSLDGPREDIYYAVKRPDKRSFSKIMKDFMDGNKPKEYKFLQVTDGIPRQAFAADEVVVIKDGKLVIE